jgi:hypothetical protein
MYRQEDLCRELASILGGTSRFENGVCTVSKPRNLHVTVMGRPAKSTAALEFAFESFGSDGTALCLAELAVLPQEINPVAAVLVRNRIPITAIHNHWLYTVPTILYFHFETVDNPVRFATQLSEVSRMLM